MKCVDRRPIQKLYDRKTPLTAADLMNDRWWPIFTSLCW